MALKRFTDAELKAHKAARSKRWRENNKVKRAESSRRWRQNNKEKYKASKKRWRDRARLERPETYIAYITNRNRKQVNRLRRQQFGTDGADLYVAQNGICKICSREMLRYAGRNLLGAVLDHDHATNQVRGWLCRACNLGIAMFGDDIERMTRAIEYVRHHGWLPVKNE